MTIHYPQQLLNIFHKNSSNKFTATLLLVDLALPTARSIVKSFLKYFGTKQKYDDLTKAIDANKRLKKR